MLTFSTEYIPDYVHFGNHIRMKVRRFRSSPKQCRSCFEYGHISDDCKNEKRCFRIRWSETHKQNISCHAKLFCFLCDGNHSLSSNECPRKKCKREVIETANVERISIGSAKRQVMGANRSENSSYAAAIKKIKLVKRKVVVDRVNPLKNVNQSRSKAEVELSAVGVGLSAAEVGPSAAEVGPSAMEVELSAVEVGPSAAGAELSTGEVVLSAVEVGVSAAKLVSSPRSKKSSSPKKQLPASEYEIVEASQSSCVATCQSDSTKASGASQAISLPEPRGSSSKGLQLFVVEVHRSEDLGSKAVRNKRLCTPSSPPLSPAHSKHFLKKVGKSLEGLSASRASKSPSSSEKKPKRTVLKTKEPKSSSSKPSLSRSVSAVILCGCDILQWNCKGLRTRAEELKVLLRDSNPGVICLQETKLGPEMFNPGLNYNIFSSAPPAGDRAHGGAAIIVHKSLQYSPLPVVTNLQAVAVTVVLDKQITICSVYLPPRAAFTNADIQSLLDQLPSPFLLLADFN